jgi:cytochrome b
MASTTRIVLRPGVRVDASAPAGQRLVWDLPVRITHWLLLLAVIGSYVTYKLGLAWFKVHVWCGYTVLVLAAFRILWGLVGTRHARFAGFVRGPATTLRHATDLARGKASRHAGHNPLGAWMVLLLLGALLVQALTGLFSNDEIASTGPLYGSVGNTLSLRLTTVHRLLFDGIAAAIALHVAAVLAYQLLKKEPLIRAMFTGRKPAVAVAAEDVIHSSRLWLAGALLALLIAALAWVVLHAPAAGPSFD